MVQKISYKEVKELQEQRLHRIIREKGNPWYHGTSITAAELIEAEGFKKNIGQLGTAFYITDSIEYAKSYAKKYGKGNGAILKLNIVDFSQILLAPFIENAQYAQEVERNYKHIVDEMLKDEKVAKINYIQYWIEKIKGLKGYGTVLNYKEDAPIKLAVYDTKILEVNNKNV
ncbi:TPA: hypothetical protein QCX11_004480, partial [Bacillus anthracis]|nr:hypothetical protein [Bacillus anthracis]